MEVGEVRLENALKFMRGWSAKAKIASMFAVGAMSERAAAECRQIIGLTDHSLKDLADLGHPYAKRHGETGAQIGATHTTALDNRYTSGLRHIYSSGPLHSPWQSVHVQSGQLLAGLKVRAPRATSTGAEAAVYNDEQPLDTMIQTGTSTMIARPYMDYVRSARANEILAAGSAEMAKRLGAGSSANLGEAS